MMVEERLHLWRRCRYHTPSNVLEWKRAVYPPHSPSANKYPLPCSWTFLLLAPKSASTSRQRSKHSRSKEYPLKAGAACRDRRRDPGSIEFDTSSPRSLNGINKAWRLEPQPRTRHSSGRDMFFRLAKPSVMAPADTAPRHRTVHCT
jgi:hypothetical protein